MRRLIVNISLNPTEKWVKKYKLRLCLLNVDAKGESHNHIHILNVTWHPFAIYSNELPNIIFTVTISFSTLRYVKDFIRIFFFHLICDEHTEEKKCKWRNTKRVKEGEREMIKNSSKRKICVQSVLLLCVAYSASKRISNEIRAQIQNAIVDTESKVCEYILCFSLLLFFSIAKRDILTKSRISDEFRMFFFYFTETHTHVTSSLHAIRFIIA